MKSSEFIIESPNVVHPDSSKFLKESPFTDSLLRLPVYHATNAVFAKFERVAHGVFISQYYDYAATHYGATIIPLYVDVRKPYNDLTSAAVEAAFDRDYETLAAELSKLKNQGYDAVYMGGDGNSYILIGDVPMVHAITGKRM